MKRLNNAMSVIICGTAGLLAVYGICLYYNYRTHPDLFAAQSAPWYYSIFGYAVIAFPVIAVCLIVKLIIRKKARNKTARKKKPTEK